MTDMTDDELLAQLGPGLTPDALDWNELAFHLGVRLLAAMVRSPDVEPHLIDIAKQALSAVASVRQLLADPQAPVTFAMIEATLRPMAMFSRSPAGDHLLRIFLWGQRRISRDRRYPESLAALAAAVRDVHGVMAEHAGQSADAAIAEERAAQLADARAILLSARD